MTTPEEARKEANLIAGRYAMHATAKRLRDLADQIEALQADADRYRFLKGTTAWQNGLDVDLLCATPAQWDLTIDAEIAARKDQP